MLLSDVSVKRPVLATVVNILLVVFGLIAFQKLPLRGYPDISPPVVSVDTRYPGASAAVVEAKITQILEDQLSGIDSLVNIESNSTDGRSQINLEFRINRDIDAAANDVREAVSRVVDRLPDEAKAPEVSKADITAQSIAWFTLSSDRLSPLELSDYVNRYVVDRFKVIEGVARVTVWGERKYVMRIALDRQALAARGLTVNDVEQALRAENIELPAGSIESAQREFVVRVARVYNTAEDFANLVVKQGADQHLVRLGEVAQVELGAHDYRSSFRGNGENMVGVGLIKQSKANTISVMREARKVKQSLEQSLPPGIEIRVMFDSAVFLERSIEEVYETLLIAMMLVILVIYFFIGSIRATLIPAVTVPVSIIASFSILYLAGFSINLLTLLAGVLAIGLVVDDTIVVLENVHRRIEQGEPRLKAAFLGAREVGFAVIATTLVLVAVFVPVIFIEGHSGRLFSEFALTLTAAVICSSFVALTLSAMLCSRILPEQKQESGLSRLGDRVFSKLEASYHTTAANMVARPWLACLLLLSCLLLTWHFHRVVPKEFDPGEDRGVFMLIVQGAEGATFETTTELMDEIERRLMPMIGGPYIESVLLRIPGFGGGRNTALGLIRTTPWEKRDKSAYEIMADIQGMVADIPGVLIYTHMRKPLASARTQPVEFVVGGDDYEEVSAWSELLLRKVRDHGGFERPIVDYLETQPQLKVYIDTIRAADLGVSVRNIGRTMETMLGEREVTTFIDRGEEYDVILEGDESTFNTKQDMQNIYVRSDRSGELIPLSNLVRVEETAGSNNLIRFNRVRSFTLSAGLKDGFSLGEAVAYLNELVKNELPDHARVGYKGITLEFVNAGSSVLFVFGVALLIAYLVLAAQFESFIHPLIVLLTVPFALLGALAGLEYAGLTLNIYSQIGIVMLIGLAAKNGILIVEFANQLRDRGLAFSEAIVTASSQRLRPIIMTAITTAVGAIPLILASEPGARSRMVIGVVVFSGVIFSTLFTLFVVPAFYALLARNTGSPGETASRLHSQLNPPS